jgi:hypothetical protein
VRNLWQLSGVYTCNARIVFVGDSEYITEVSSNHLPGYDNSKVLGFYVTNQNVGFLPRNISNFFPNIEGLGLYEMGITELKRQDLEPFPKLKAIDLNGNKIEEVSENLFAGNPLVHSISFSRNPVRHVSPEVFNHLNDLYVLNFDVTTCISSYVESKSQVPGLILKLAANCPPTFDMTYKRIKAKLLEEFKLDMKPDLSISKRINELTNLLNQTNERLEKIEARLTKLEIVWT